MVYRSVSINAGNRSYASILKQGLHLHGQISDCKRGARIYLFIWGFTSLSTLYRSYHDG